MTLKTTVHFKMKSTKFLTELRARGLQITEKEAQSIGLNYFYVINDCRKKKINKTKAIVNGGFDNYEEAREELVIEIIRTYKSEQL